MIIYWKTGWQGGLFQWGNGTATASMGGAARIAVVSTINRVITLLATLDVTVTRLFSSEAVVGVAEAVDERASRRAVATDAVVATLSSSEDLVSDVSTGNEVFSQVVTADGVVTELTFSEVVVGNLADNEHPVGRVSTTDAAVTRTTVTEYPL